MDDNLVLGCAVSFIYFAPLVAVLSVYILVKNQIHFWNFPTLKNLVKWYDSKDLNLAISYKGFGYIFEILQLYKSREIVGATI